MKHTNISAKEFTRIIRWSEEDHAFIGSLPELCGDYCHSPSDPLKVAAMLDDLAEQAYAACVRFNLPFDPPGSALVVIGGKKKHAVVAQLVRGIRHHLGLTQRDFATALGVSMSTLSKWETGERCPDAAAYKLLRILQKNSNLITA